MNYRQACIKRSLEQTLIYPLVLLGRLLGLLMPYRHRSPFFLFFPSDDIGGATKVNADILQLLAAHQPAVVFSKKYANTGFAAQFLLPGVPIIDLRHKIDSKLFYFINIIYRGILSTWINRSGTEVVFGGASIYFYKVIPYLHKRIRVVELSHVNNWLNYNQAFIKYMDLRITSTPRLKRETLQQYTENGVPEKYKDRVAFIDNWVDIPAYKKKEASKLHILFVGRGAPQKRVHIISAIAETILKQTDKISFTFVGDVSPLLSEYVRTHARVLEHVDGKTELPGIYDSADVLILTSAYEGLPIVVMDMMVRGKVVLSTAVDGIPDYITHRETGLLIDELQDEKKIADEAVKLIFELEADRQLLDRMGSQAYAFARERFTRRLFETKYREVFGIK